MFVCIIFTFLFGLGVVTPAEYNTTAAATNIESTIGTPAILVNPTLTASQNTTDPSADVQYEVSFNFEF